MQIPFPRRLTVVVIWAISVISIGVLFLMANNNRLYHKYNVYPSIGSKLSNILRSGGNTDSQFQVLLHTYMRSGSSFTAEILAHHPHLFYVFEPLYPIDILNQLNQHPFFPFFGSGARIIEDKKDLIDLNRQTIDNYLRCNIADLDLFTLTSYHLKHSESTAPYKNCTHEKHGLSSVLDCLDGLKHRCEASKGVLIKTIRIDMEMSKHFLTTFPKLKLLHLVRDPRATLVSQFNTMSISHEEWHRTLFNISKGFCEKVLQDLEMSLQLLAEHPDRVQILMYDDIAANPIEISEKIHDFIGLDFTQKERDIIVKKTSGKGLTNLNDNMSTDKGNSSQAANNWRGYTKFDDVQIMDEACGPLLYDKLGLIYIRDKYTFKHLDNSLRKEATVPFLK